MDLFHEIRIELRAVFGFPLLPLIGHESQGDVPSHLRVTDEPVFLRGPNIDDLHFIRCFFPFFVGLRRGYKETQGGLLSFGKLVFYGSPEAGFIVSASTALAVAAKLMTAARTRHAKAHFPLKQLLNFSVLNSFILIPPLLTVQFVRVIDDSI